jgi:feruloyl esterase
MGTSPGPYEMVGHPERWADFGFRSTHEMTTASKAILEVYYKGISKNHFVDINI